MYMGFAFLTLWGYRKSYLEQGKAYRRKALLVVLAISIAYGALTEIMQEQLIPKRTGSVYDWILSEASWAPFCSIFCTEKEIICPIVRFINKILLISQRKSFANY